MNFARSFFFLFLIAGLSVWAVAADDGTKPASSVSSPSQTAKTALFGPSSQDALTSPGLFFLDDEKPVDKKPRLDLAHPLDPKSAIAHNDAEICLTMRMYKVKRTER